MKLVKISKLNSYLLTLFLSLPTISFASDEGKVIVANRASGTISIIDSYSDTVIGTIALPTAINKPEPMYVVHSPDGNRIFVGDRANNRVVVFNDETYEVETSVTTGKGVFHMWVDVGDKQLWVNNDIDNTATVIDPVTLEVLATVSMPDDIVALGGKPHDVTLDPSGEFAYVSMIGVAGAYDVVVKFSTDTFTEVLRADVGKDPHLSVTRENKILYVPTQNNNAVYILSRKDLSLIELLSIPGAHGAAIPRNGKTFYTTNISGGGVQGLYSINTKSNELLGDGVDIDFPVPHNIVLDRSSRKLYITHSGAQSNTVTVFIVNPETGIPVYKSAIVVGNNPFGLTFMK